MKREQFLIFIILLFMLLTYASPIKGEDICNSFSPDSCPEGCTVVTIDITTVRCERGTRTVDVCVDIAEACAAYSPDSCPSPDCEVTSETVPKGFFGCEGTEQVPVCTKAQAEEIGGYCFPETIKGIIPPADLPARSPATYLYEDKATVDWKLDINRETVNVIVPQFKSQGEWGETIIEPTKSELSNEHCKFYSFSFQRESGAVLSYTLPLKEEFSSEATKYCVYDLSAKYDEISYDLDRFGGGNPVSSICPELQKGKELKEVQECPPTAECSITISEGQEEYFAYSLETDFCSNQIARLVIFGFPIPQESINSLAEEFISECSARYSQCNDGIDNDNDGTIDYPNDPGCFYEGDTSEGDIRNAPCMELYQGTNNPAENRANVIFVPYGYTHISDVTKDVRWQVDNLLKTEPFNSSRDKFNFWVVGEIGNIEDCEETLMFPLIEESKMLVCPKDPANLCPVLSNRFINVLADDVSNNLNYRSRASPLDGSTSLFRSGATQFLFTHEFGHSFGKLLDEYTEPNEFFQNFPNLLPINGPNCYSTMEDTTYWQCELYAPWKDKFGNGCGQEGVIDCIENPDCRFDINQDGKLTFDDSSTLLDSIVNNEELGTCISNEQTLMIGDLNKDGLVDSIDADQIAEVIATGVYCKDGSNDCHNEVGCFEGCFYFAHGAFRPTPCSIMKDRYNCPEFGPVNEKVLQDKLSQYLG